MVTNYPFSVVLDVENNPYLTTSGGQASLPYSQANAGIEIQRKLREAAEHVRAVYNQQLNAYNNFNEALRIYGDGATLEDLFKQQYDLSKSQDQETEQSSEINKTIEESKDAIEKLQKAQNKFHQDFLGAVSNIAKASSVEELNTHKVKVLNEASKLENLLKEALARFGNTKIIGALKTTKQKKGEFQLYHDGQHLRISFEKDDDKKPEKEYLKIIADYYFAMKALAKEANTSWKELGSNFLQSKNFREDFKKNHKDEWEKYEKSQKALSKIGKNNDETFSSNYSRESIRSIRRYIRSLVLGGDPAPLTIRTLDQGEALVQAASFAFEGAAVLQFEQGISEILGSEGSVNSFVIDVPLRVQFSKLPLADDKERALSELYNRRDQLDEEFSSYFRTQKVLDKVDAYVSVDFKKSEINRKHGQYVLAFSNKLYHDLNRLGVVGGYNKSSLLTEEGKELIDKKSMTSLKNTYDLIAQAGAVADNFMFAVLNGSDASGLKPEDQTSLERWLTSFIYEIAFNPASFIQDIEQSIRNNLKQSNIIYFFNAGAKIEPAYKILLNIYNFLMNTVDNIQSCVQTIIQFDESSDAGELLKQAGEKYPPETNAYGHEKYSPKAWSFVANQVAHNTLVSVHLDLLALQAM